MHVVRRAACTLVLLLVALVGAQATTSPAGSAVSSTPRTSADDLQLYVDKFLRLCPKLSRDAETRVKLTSNLRRILYGSNTVLAAAANTELLSARYLQARADVGPFRMLPDQDRADFAEQLTQGDGSSVWKLAESKAATGRRSGLFSFLDSFEMEIERPTKTDTLRARVRSLLGSTSQLNYEVELPSGETAGPGGTGFVSVHPSAARTAPEAAAARAQMQEKIRAVLGTKRMRQLLRATPNLNDLVILDGSADFDVPRIETAVLMRLVRQEDGSYVEDPPPEQPGGGAPARPTEPAPKPQAGGLAAGLAGPAMLMALSSMSPAQLGGIDFADLGLRYLSDAPGKDDDRAVSYAFQAPTGGGRPGVVSEGIANARQASDAFFVWLALRRPSFWVNLQPNQPERIIDPTFGQTDAGRVLLQADLKLKRSIFGAMRPSTPTGARFWRGVALDRSAPVCIAGVRVWITSDVARIHEEGDRLYILDAPLKVEMETDYQPPAGAVPVSTCPSQSAAVARNNARLMRDIVLPALNREVNTAAPYAPLRRVYLSRVAAEWYRERSTTRATAYESIIDSGRIERWRRTDSWQPRQTYDAYIRSYRNGDGRFTVRGARATFTVAYGGVDFARVRSTNVDRATFDREFAPLRAGVALSLGAGPAATNGWLGAQTEVDPTEVAEEFPRAVAARPTTPEAGLSKPAAVVVGGFGLAGAALVVVALVRARPRKAAHD